MYFVYNNLVRSYREKTHEELRNPRREHPTSSFPFPPSPLPIPSHPHSYPLRNPFSKVGVKSGRREQELREKGDYERLSAKEERERETVERRAWVRGQERLRLYSLAELPIPYSAVIRCIPVRRACCCYCCSRWRNRGEKEREREKEGHASRERDEDSGHFCLGLQRACDVRHALSLSVAPPVYTSLSVGGSSTTRTQRSLSVAREPRPEQHGLVVVRSIIAPTDTRSSPPLFLPT